MRIHRTQNSLGGWQQLPAFLLRQPRFPEPSSSSPPPPLVLAFEARDRVSPAAFCTTLV